MRILLGMSGGVDSAYAAKKLMNEGHSVEGAILVMHEHTELLPAREAAASLNIPLHEIDCRKRFDSIVKENFVREYAAARTPNPCIICNERVKMAVLSEHAIAHGFDRIATGHYARVGVSGEGDGKRYFVMTAEDSTKDQSYMLYRLSQDILSRLVLPLSDITKQDVRRDAREASIPSAERKDSQEICFLPDGGHAEFIEKRIGSFPEGDFIDSDGNVLGRHKGIIRYTVGQRKGLGIALGARAFVTEINPMKNTVTLSTEMTGKSSIKLTDLVFSGICAPAEEKMLTAEVKIRYKAPLVKAKITIFPDNTATLALSEPVKPAPGQSAVVYCDGRVLFGGFIE